MEISIKWNVCRVCLQEPEEKNTTTVSGMRSIFNDPKLAKQIYDCAGVMMKPDDCLPEKICRNCLLVLKYAVNFRTTCRNSDEYLQSVIQKTKSATSLFKLDKHREETMELVDEVIEQIFDKDEDEDMDAEEGGHGDSVRGKTNRIHSIENVNNKSKLADRCTEVQHAKNCSDDLLAKNERYKGETRDVEHTEVATIEIDNNEPAIDRPKEQHLIEIIVDEEEEETQPEDIEEIDIEEEGSDCKKKQLPKITSVCSIHDDFIEDCDEAQNNNLDSSKHENNALQSFIVTEVKHEAATHIGNGESIQMRTTGTSHISEDTDELFYILNETDIKQESDRSDQTHIEESSTIEFIQMEELDEKKESDDIKISNIAITALDQIEYLVDESVEDNFESEVQDEQIPLTTSSATVTFKRAHLQHTRKRIGAISFYVCDICGNNFTSRSLMNYHMKVHRNEKNYECELCFKRFNAACNLTAHMRIHTGEKKFECQFCGRRFTDRSTHIKHERIHTNEKPFTCAICAKSFSLSTTLKAHEKIHTGEKPFKCGPCDKSFKLPHQLKAHFNTHLHKMLSVEQILEEKPIITHSSK